jgi:quercetin dioxygenase-like cupin family protein
MGTIRISSPSDTPQRATTELATADVLDKMSDGERAMTVRLHHAGTATEPQLLEISMRPGDATQAHAHDEHEIVFVIEGELHLGARVVGAGSSVYIPANTMYALRAGPEGLRFLNFRARQDLTYITRGEYRQVRSCRRPGNLDQ